MTPAHAIGYLAGFTAIGALMVGAAWLTVWGPHWPTLLGA